MSTLLLSTSNLQELSIFLQQPIPCRLTPSRRVSSSFLDHGILFLVGFCLLALDLVGGLNDAGLLLVISRASLDRTEIMLMEYYCLIQKVKLLIQMIKMVKQEYEYASSLSQSV